MSTKFTEITRSENYKIIAKKILSNIFYTTSLSKGLLNNLGNNGIYIVIYHQILPDSYPYPKPYISVSPKSFREQIAFFKEYFKVVSLDEVFDAIIQKERLSSNYLAITFDDGYLDNYEYAFPILQNYGVPATIFVPVAPVDRTILLWPDVVRFICYTTGRAINSIVKFQSLGEIQLNLQVETDRIETVKKLLSLLKTFTEEDKGKALDELADYLGVNLADMNKDAVMDWDSIRKLYKSGITIGSHTLTHPILRNLDSDSMRQEIFRSKARLEEQLGTEIVHFAYPNGTKNDLTPEIVDTVRKAGYHTGLTTIRGINYPGADPLRLCRTGIYRTDSIQDVVFKLCVEKMLRFRVE